MEALLKRMKPEKPTGKACPTCGKRILVQARDWERTVRSLSGPITFKHKPDRETASEGVRRSTRDAVPSGRRPMWKHPD